MVIWTVLEKKIQVEDSIMSKDLHGLFKLNNLPFTIFNFEHLLTVVSPQWISSLVRRENLCFGLFVWMSAILWRYFWMISCCCWTISLNSEVSLSLSSGSFNSLRISISSQLSKLKVSKNHGQNTIHCNIVILREWCFFYEFTIIGNVKHQGPI